MVYDTIKYCKLSKLYRRKCLSKIHLLAREAEITGSGSSVAQAEKSQAFFQFGSPLRRRPLPPRRFSRTFLKLMAIAQLYSEELRKSKLVFCWRNRPPRFASPSVPPRGARSGTCLPRSPTRILVKGGLNRSAF